MEQIAPALFLSRQLFGGIVRGNVRINGRVPLRIVDAIKYSKQISTPLLQNSIESIAELRRPDLFRIRLANSRNRVRIDNAAFQKVERVVFLKLFESEHV